MRLNFLTTGIARQINIIIIIQPAYCSIVVIFSSALPTTNIGPIKIYSTNINSIRPSMLNINSIEILQKEYFMLIVWEADVIKFIFVVFCPSLIVYSNLVRNIQTIFLDATGIFPGEPIPSMTIKCIISVYPLSSVMPSPIVNQPSSATGSSQAILKPNEYIVVTISSATFSTTSSTIVHCVQCSISSQKVQVIDS